MYPIKYLTGRQSLKTSRLRLKQIFGGLRTKRVRQQRNNIGATLKRAARYARPYRRDTALIVLLTLVISLCSLALPRLVGEAIDFSLKPNGWRTIKILIGIYTLLLIVRIGASLSRNYLMPVVGSRATNDLRMDIFTHLQKLSLRFYEERQTGRIVSRVTEDAHAMNMLITGPSVTLLGDLVMALGVCLLLFFLNWKLALVSILLIPCFIFNYTWHRRRMRTESRFHMRNWGRVVDFINERVTYNHIVRAFATEEGELDVLRNGLRADCTHYQRVMWRSSLMLAIAEFLSGFAQMIALAFGTWLVLYDGHFTTGELFAFLGYLGLLYTPIVRTFEANTLIQKSVSSLEKIFAILDTSPHIPDNDTLPPFPRIAGSIEFRNVSFSYRIGQVTLNKVNFSIAPGEMIALVGPSGAGKSTIITLLSRFYDPTQGEILIDGKRLTDFNVQSLRRQVGIVMQESILFSGTIEDNIRYARPEASREEVIEAAKAAHVHEFVQKLKNGYHSRVGERGVSLSGGQRQRLAIARVLLKQPRILILDEATSALDSESEQLIQVATENLMRDRTAIVIAHRLSTVINATRIFVMDHGQIVDIGTHQELLARAGIYRNLYEIQFQRQPGAALN